MIRKSCENLFQFHRKDDVKYNTIDNYYTFDNFNFYILLGKLHVKLGGYNTFMIY